jgi:hypothetical protein
MTTAEKTAMGREGRGVRCFEDDMFFCIDERFLFLSMTSPEEEIWGNHDFLRECESQQSVKVSHHFPACDMGCTSFGQWVWYSGGERLALPNVRDHHFLRTQVIPEISLNFLKYIHAGMEDFGLTPAQRKRDRVLAQDHDRGLDRVWWLLLSQRVSYPSLQRYFLDEGR